MSIIRETRIPVLVFLWSVAGCYYALWEFGLLKKKNKKKGGVKK